MIIVNLFIDNLEIQGRKLYSFNKDLHPFNTGIS